ncbi:hypothetical protein Tsubulata_044809, partial [Turnera subulata]
VLHPLLMVIGFILISGEGKWIIHEMVAWFKKFEEISAFVSSRSGFGLWGFWNLDEWLMGFLSFWHRGEVRTARVRVLPWHIFLGLYTYGLAVATAETGLLEKLTFLQTNRNVPKHSPESMVVNGLGLGLALLSGIVILAAVSPKYQQSLQSKIMYSESNTTKCLSS